MTEADASAAPSQTAPPATTPPADASALSAATAAAAEAAAKAEPHAAPPKKKGGKSRKGASKGGSADEAAEDELVKIMLQTSRCWSEGRQIGRGNVVLATAKRAQYLADRDPPQARPATDEEIEAAGPDLPIID